MNYTYQGPRKDLRGATFAIENQHAKIMLSSNSSPGRQGNSTDRVPIAVFFSKPHY